jgi:uncharacterized protein (UPF0262 family)
VVVLKTGQTAYVAELGTEVAIFDLVNEETAGRIAAEDRPFAVAVSCTGSACTAPP